MYFWCLLLFNQQDSHMAFYDPPNTCKNFKNFKHTHVGDMPVSDTLESQ